MEKLAAPHGDLGIVARMDATDPMTPPEVPGYRLGERLGSGATGTVWSALRSRDLLPVAVKVVPVGAPDEAGDEAADEAGGHAARELAVLGRVAVEGLVGFHEAIGLDTDPPSVALVLDHVAGGSLWSAVRARGHLSVGESVTVLVPVARALAGLHAMGVVHGDVSPRNVLLQRSGQPVLSDLGVARVTGVADAHTYGTTGFVAPELEGGSPPTAASDVYAVGALGWWCVTGVVPTPASLRQPLDAVAPGLPESWRAVTAQALSRDPAERPTAAELALAYFDSAPCEPLRLVVGADDTSLLTHRLRRSEPSPPAAGHVADGRSGPGAAQTAMAARGRRCDDRAGLGGGSRRVRGPSAVADSPASERCDAAANDPRPRGAARPHHRSGRCPSRPHGPDAGTRGPPGPGDDQPGARRARVAGRRGIGGHA